MSGRYDDMVPPSESEVRALELLAQAERARARRIQQVGLVQTGAIRETAKRKSKRKAAKAARKRGRG